MLETFSSKAVYLIDSAKKLCYEMNETKDELIVSTYYLLLAMFLEEDTICHFLLSEESITIDELNEAYNTIKRKEEGTIYSSYMNKIVKDATTLCSKLSQEYVYDEHLFYVMLENEDCEAYLVLEKLLKSPSSLLSDIEDIFSFYTKEVDLNPLVDKPDDFLIDLRKVKRVHPYIERNDYTNIIIHILSKYQKNNPLLIGESGCGKSAIVEEICHKYDLNIYRLDLGRVLAGTKYRGEMEQKIISAINFAKSSNAILFIDEIHNIVGSGGSEGSLDLANILKPVLSSNEIKVIGATTLNEYYQYIYKDHALRRRFQNVFIKSATLTESLKILKGLKSTYESYYNTNISVSDLKFLIDKVTKTFKDATLPDILIDILDESLTYINKSKESLKTSIVKTIYRRSGILSRKYSELLHITLLNEELRPLLLRKCLDIEFNNSGIIQITNERFLSSLYQDFYKVYHITREMILEIDSSSYSSYESLSDLTGSRKGYVGFDEGGLLYNHLLKYPYSCVIIKNYKEATSSFKSFLQRLLNNSYVIDSHSRYISLKNTFFIIVVENRSSLGFIKGNSTTKSIYDIVIDRESLSNNLYASILLRRKINIIDFDKCTEDLQKHLFLESLKLQKGTYIISDKHLIKI